MRSSNLTFDMNYLYDMDDQLFNLLTNDYEFKCDNYAVAYQLLEFLDRLRMCEHSNIEEDCFWPYSRIIFITCRPQDIGRIKCVAKRLPSSIPANIRIYDENEEEV